MNEKKVGLISSKFEIRIGIPIFFILIFIISFPLLTQFWFIFFNISKLPFTLVHELGHFTTIVVLLPEITPRLEINLFTQQIFSGRVRTEGIPIGWEAVFLFLAGPLPTILIILSGIHLSKAKESIVLRFIENYLLFILLNELINLLPVLPSQLSTVTDGYGIFLNLQRIYNLPSIPEILSTLFLIVGALLFLFSLFFIGMMIHTTMELIETRMKHKEM